MTTETALSAEIEAKLKAMAWDGVDSHDCWPEHGCSELESNYRRLVKAYRLGLGQSTPGWRDQEQKDDAGSLGNTGQADSGSRPMPRRKHGRMPPCVCGHGWPMHIIPGGVENIDIYPTERHCVDCACRNYVERKPASICMFCNGCGWCEGSPAFTCPKCQGTGEESNLPAPPLSEGDPTP